MVADRIHLVRHGEVHNPDGVLYGRLPNFGLSARGAQMAALAAQAIQASGRPVTAIFSSPLQRAKESAKPFIQAFGLEAIVEDRIIEPYNIFEGRVVNGTSIFIKPHLWFHLRNPSKPSWGEPYTQIVERVEAAVMDAFNSVQSGDVVMVSHQLPIWMMHSKVAGRRLPHNPNQRRCALSSITSFELRDGKLVEVDYQDPAFELRKNAIDVGAV